MKTDFITKYTNTVMANMAIMMLYDAVGVDEQSGKGIRGTYFAEEMYWHKSQGRHVKVYINCPGGQVFDGFSIIQAILDCGADTHIVGMAASMAGVISQFGAYRTANDFAIGMVHGASGENAGLTKMINDLLKDCLTKKSKLSTQQINKMMSSTEPTWLSAEDMLDYGLVDEVIETGMESNEIIKLKKSKIEVLNVNESFKIYCDIVNSLDEKQKLNTTEMDEIKAVGAELGIENATKDSVLTKIKEMKQAATNNSELQTKLTAAETSKTEAETAKTNAENSFKAERKARATELVENAIKAGKIKEEAKQSYIDLAVSNYDTVKQTIDGINTGTHNSVMNHMDANAGGATPVVEDYEELAKNNPTKLKEIAEKEPEKFNKLVAEFEKKNKK